MSAPSTHSRLSAETLCAVEPPATLAQAESFIAKHEPDAGPLHAVGDRVTVTFTACVGQSRRVGGTHLYELSIATSDGLMPVRDVPAFRLSAMEGV